MLQMSLIERYVGRTVVTSILVTLGVLVGISSLFRFIEQLKYIGRADFTAITAGLYSLYLVPQDIEIFFPMAAMIGGLVGLGALAQNSELVVMQAVGMSKTNVISAVLKASTVLIIIMMFFSEWGVPTSVRAATELKSQAISSGKVYSAEQGIWAKDTDAFVNIKEVTEEGTLIKVEVFDFDHNLKLKRQLSAESGAFDNGHWVLNNVVIRSWFNRQITTETHDVMPWPTDLAPDKLGIVSIRPERMAFSELLDYLDYLERNEQNANRYELAFWRKVFQPINVAVMLLLALSFIFGPLRSVTMGARIIMGILTGFAFFLFDRVFGSMSLVYQIPPVIGAFSPTLVFSLVALRLLTKKQK
ncbi:LPS export ABC transporter permease LptG [Psychrosphaera sp. B3R10]|uniref:LPS export ABC transporter permease LptG n=1 Tax=unclassified Psychrosphaera TaxID=2641570 RepID=UPI001C0934B1|nr:MULTISPECIES: LPS export ABC transporter permease LptG [unclassified Psychrosphaera]MBU2883917.1 LPS export ABC transporter permease LptG [Psychrosphaera sp. I2R16]MBU2991576.1 LPS export ABC transporter permease LptG [Psychrosphaera sp. B3R10]MDO6719204.1 LPS export ABC transporter permease LptG [Psychrosphaera sp. 1_MG-2023]